MMYDIAKCQNKTCQLKTTCRRWESTPSEGTHRQVYVLYPEDHRTFCNDYWITSTKQNEHTLRNYIDYALR